jgi:cell wall-associated NlpC family hydrolase
MIRYCFLLLVVALLAACGSMSTAPDAASQKSAVAARLHGGPEDVVIFSLGLLETRYRFGGRNPDAGFDCSGMVSYVFDKAVGLRLSGSAADIAKFGRPVSTADMKPGDLVFFNTLRRSRSHVGIYLGDGRFIHAPSNKGSARVRTDSLTEGYFASRFEEARTYFD